MYAIKIATTKRVNIHAIMPFVLILDNDSKKVSYIRILQVSSYIITYTDLGLAAKIATLCVIHNKNILKLF